MTTLVVQSSDSNLIRAISGIWDQLKRVFEVIINDSGSTEKDIMSSRGFLSEMNNIEFPFLAVVFNDIFTFTDFIFDFLQNKSLDITYCVGQLESASNVLKSRRDEFYLLALFDKAINLSGMTGVTRSSVRVLYFQVLDNILMQIDVRFKDYSKLQFISLVDPTQFIKYQRNFPVGAFDQLEKCYPNIFNRQRLKNELCLLYSLNESYKDFSLEEVLSALRENKDVFEESCKLFSLVLTLPSVSSSLERKFSFLQRFKKYSSNLRVSSLANIEFHKELLAELSEGGLFYDDVIDRIAVLEDGKIDLIYEQIGKSCMIGHMLCCVV
ncbi:hypothetical protein C0J52_02832 [Blattella germanica]|nr:hypothetical protein C0J52_02832 [Blattella germanica]